MQSAIRGDELRGTGILGNDLYVGRYIWNRSQWVKDPDSGRRKNMLRPRADWVTHEMPELRIVSDELWQSAKARQRVQAERIGEAVRRRIAMQSARPPGGVPKYLLSGLLVCGQCGSKFVVVNRTSYGCAGHVNGRLCQNNLLVRRDLAEELLLAGIRGELLTPEIEVEARRRIARKLAERIAPNPTSKRRSELQAQTDNLAEAIRPACCGRPLPLRIGWRGQSRKTACLLRK